jgi:hypothetical protein
MSGYPVIEHEGHCASVSTKKEATGRWMAWVHFERSPDYARLRVHEAPPHRVHNDYPSEEKAVLGAYDFARELIARGLAESP